MDIKIEIIYEDNDVLVLDKPAGMSVFPEGEIKDKTLVDYLLDKFPYLKEVGQSPRYGIVHRLDKDTSGILLVAKNNESLEFLQKQFKEKKVEKKYLALAVENLKNDEGKIETLIGRSPKDKRKQKVFLEGEPKSAGKRTAVTEYKVRERFKGYTLLEISPETGRKHQIRSHLAYLGHPIAGDKLYGFKNQPCPKNLSRQFLHAFYLKITLHSGQEKEFRAELPTDLKNVIKYL